MRGTGLVVCRLVLRSSMLPWSLDSNTRVSPSRSFSSSSRSAARKGVQPAQMVPAAGGVLAVAGLVRQEVLVQGEVVTPGLAPQDAPGLGRGARLHREAPLQQLGVGEILIDTALGVQVIQGEEGLAPRQVGHRGGRELQLPLPGQLEKAGPEGVDEAGVPTGIVQLLQQRVVQQDGPQGVVGEPRQVLAQRGLAVDPGKKGGLTGGALGHPLHPPAPRRWACTAHPGEPGRPQEAASGKGPRSCAGDWFRGRGPPAPGHR